MQSVVGERKSSRVVKKPEFFVPQVSSRTVDEDENDSDEDNNNEVSKRLIPKSKKPNRTKAEPNAVSDTEFENVEVAAVKKSSNKVYTLKIINGSFLGMNE
jgi:hypothetical protein